MIRSFKNYTIRLGGKPQPLVGALVAAAVAPGARVSVQVDDSSMFALMDYVFLCEKDGTLAEMCQVVAIANSTHVTLDNVVNAHVGGAVGTGAWLGLAIAINATYVQAVDGNTGTLYLGTAPTMVKATGVSVVAQLKAVAAGVQPVDFHDGRNGPANMDKADGWWIDGTTNDSYLPSFGRI